MLTEDVSHNQESRTGEVFDIQPYFEITYIDKFGVAILEFNELINLPQNLTDINSTVLTLTIESESELYLE